jgi:hypothetical protein
MTFFYVACFSFSPHNYEVPVLVSNTGVACAGVRPRNPFNLYFLPVGYILVPNLLDDANGVNVVEENLAGPLTAVDEDFIIYDAAAVGVSGFGHVANLLALVPSQGLSCKVLNLL